MISSNGLTLEVFWSLVGESASPAIYQEELAVVSFAL